MQIKKIAIGGAAATTLGLAAMLGSGTAFASTPSPAAPAATSSTVQQGDQTTPDTGTSSETTGTEAPETAGTGTTATEAAGTESGVSDGLGGHQDPAGAVDHQYNGQE